MRITIQRSNRKNKQFKVELPEGTVHFSHPDYELKSGTPDGDNYCARSFKQPGASDPYSANYWARRMWGCLQGKSSRKRALRVGDKVDVKLK